MLILFDIDGTLLLTEGAGIKAMQDAGRELFGDRFTVDGVEFSGRLDPLIWRDLAAHNEIHNPDEHLDAFRAGYGRHLERRLDDTARAIALPGTLELIDRLRTAGEVTLGLLTGNWPETGGIKLAAAGIELNHFAIRAWGIDGATRRELPCAAMKQYERMRGNSLSYESVVIIGDTPHDVDCAKHHCCRALGVATGNYTVEQLLDCGADHALPDLAETDAVYEWLLQSRACAAE